MASQVGAGAGALGGPLLSGWGGRRLGQGQAAELGCDGGVHAHLGQLLGALGAFGGCSVGHSQQAGCCDGVCGMWG